MFRNLFRRKSKTPQPTPDQDPKKAPPSDEPDAPEDAQEAEPANTDAEGDPTAEDANDSLQHGDAPDGHEGEDEDQDEAEAEADDEAADRDPPPEALEVSAEVTAVAAADPAVDVDVGPDPPAAEVVEAPDSEPQADPEPEVAAEPVAAEESVSLAPEPPPESPAEAVAVPDPPATTAAVATVEEGAAATEEPPKKRGFFRRLRDGLSKTRATLTRQVTSLLSFGRSIDDDLLDELEEVLIQADVGIATTMRLVERLREEAAKQGLRDASELQPVLRAEIEAIFAGGDVGLDVESAKPFVLLVIGVNGVGKTTTIGKLAARWTGEGKKVVVAAADTFRAAAIEQLEVWCDRAGADLIRQEQGSDAASVVYDAVHAANARNADVLIIDTAGRLHTKKNLMQELEKINRVAAREVEGAPHEVLLVLDATTGQNAVEQARQFSQIAAVSGIALTKLDSSAKGGVVIAVRDELDIPVKLIGIGESIDDLRDFDGAAFVEALLAAEDDG
jgi:fused signal recognition particle receptor